MASSELLEFRSLITAIKTEIELLKEVVLSETEEKEENEILCRFITVVETQVFSTLYNLAIYQLRGWRELINE